MTDELQVPTHRLGFFLRLRPWHRLLAGFLAVGITYILIRKIVIDQLVLAMVLWDVFCVCMLFFAWIVVFSCSPPTMRSIARREDGSRAVVFVLILVSSLASMVTVLFLIISKSGPGQHLFYLAVAVAGMLLSWTMVHTTFCFHYAYMYYGDDDDQPEKHAGGLLFPADDPPDYLDFAYFSFVIGMTFQVSDVQIASRRIRRQVLVHGLLSFALNTFVVALTVNLIAGLK